MKPISCQIRTIVQVSLNIDDEDERWILENSDTKMKEVDSWVNGYLIEIKPVTKTFISDNSQVTMFFGIVWGEDEQIRSLPLSDIRVSGREIYMLVRKEWS